MITCTFSASAPSDMHLLCQTMVTVRSSVPLRHRLILCVLFLFSFKVSFIFKFTAISVQI